MNAAESVPSLYVHVPFCAHKCEYCAFYSEASNGELINRYVRALLREFDLVAPRLKPKTIFFGGGTPSLLNIRQWEGILQAMEEHGFLGATEWTIECNPATVSLDKARLWRDFGVNRISMGVQSLDETMLERLGRIHSREMVFRSFKILRDAGFENINIDLMFAIPGQTMEIWLATLAAAIHMGSEHLSCYEVIYEEDTPLFHQLQAGQFSVDEDLAAAMYDEMLAKSEEAGYVQYEIANFARNDLATDSAGELPSRACRHNVNYWRGGAYFGLGPSATGFVDGVRTKNWSNTQMYCDQLEKNRRAIESEENMPSLKRAGETAAFGLRMNQGWPFGTFQSVTGFDLRTEWADEMKELSGRGWGILAPERFRLTRTGLRFADAAAEMFLR